MPGWTCASLTWEPHTVTTTVTSCQQDLFQDVYNAFLGLLQWTSLRLAQPPCYGLPAMGQASHFSKWAMSEG